MANQFAGKASSDNPALKPYRGKPAVRNFRGGNGNVGIIRSPVRAIALPDSIVRHRRGKGFASLVHPVGQHENGFPPFQILTLGYRLLLETKSRRLRRARSLRYLAGCLRITVALINADCSGENF
jgi:hypothetical protein